MIDPKNPPAETAHVPSSEPEAEKPRHRPIPSEPDPSTLEDRAYESFFDSLIDTDGKPNRDAKSIVETEGFDDEDDDERD